MAMARRQFQADLLGSTGHLISPVQGEMEFDEARFDELQPDVQRANSRVFGVLHLPTNALPQEVIVPSDDLFLRRGDYYKWITIKGCTDNRVEFEVAPDLWFDLGKMADVATRSPEPCLPVYSDWLYRCRQDLILPTYDTNFGTDEPEVTILYGSLFAIEMPQIDLLGLNLPPPDFALTVIWSSQTGRLSYNTVSILKHSVLVRDCELAVACKDYHGPHADELPNTPKSEQG